MADPKRKGREATAYELDGDAPPDYKIDPKVNMGGSNGQEAPHSSMTFGGLSMQESRTGGIEPPSRAGRGAEANLDPGKGTPLPARGREFGDKAATSSMDNDSQSGGDGDGNDVGAAQAGRS